MYSKSNSAGKSQVKQSQSIRRTDYYTCSKLTETDTHKNDYERTQPIKIAQLLRKEENLKTTHKDSVRKRAQPERLGPLSSVKNKKINKESDGINANGQSTCFDKHVRRNLNFNENTENNIQENNEIKNKPKKYARNNSTCKNVTSMSRNSLLLPPNTIKYKYLHRRTTVTTKCSKIDEESKEVVPSVKLSDARIFPSMQKENQRMEVNSSLSLNNKSPGKDNNPTQFECIESLSNDLQGTTLVEPKNDINNRCTLSEIIHVDRSMLIHLECELNNLLRTEEDKISKIKSTLTCIQKLLFVNNEKDVKCNVSTEQNCSEPEEVPIIMLNKEVQVGICCKLMQNSKENLEVPPLHVPEDYIHEVKPLSANELNKNNENNKENHEITNEINGTNKVDDSFLDLENQFNTIYGKLTQDHSTQPKTPTITNCKQQRSLREYMTLKSSMNFLETPDGKRFCSLYQKKNIDTSNLSKSYISNKLLNDIQNLCSDSPELE
ncbi:metacaspase-2-like [Hylaeus anthracinus]|uniref:metacaspase-2-like n=1 Tax=Hylaeus anthracinus TaxID=313031 RepID=UPI0023BA378C|nr:metacaspase-2-like [Hylaeus anthracinus]